MTSFKVVNILVI